MAKERKTPAELRQMISERLGEPDVWLEIYWSHSGWDAFPMVPGGAPSPDLLRRTQAIAGDLKKLYDAKA